MMLPEELEAATALNRKIWKDLVDVLGLDLEERRHLIITSDVRSTKVQFDSRPLRLKQLVALAEYFKVDDIEVWTVVGDGPWSLTITHNDARARQS